MVAQAEEGIKLTQQEARLANVMVNGTSNLARNMAAEFMKTRNGDEEENTDFDKIKEQANIELNNRRRARRALMKDEFDDLAECMPRGHTRRIVSSSDDGSDHHVHHRLRNKARKAPRHRLHQHHHHHASHNHHNKRRKAKRDQQHIADLISRECLL